MNFWKRRFWPPLLIILLICAAGLYLIFAGGDHGKTAEEAGADGPAATGSEAAHAAGAESSAEAAGGEGLANGAGPEVKRQAEAVAELQEENWILAALREDGASGAEGSPFEFHNAIIDEVERIVLSPEFSLLAEKKEEARPGVIEGRVGKGDTMSAILEKSVSGDVRHYISAAKKVFSLSGFKAGHPYMVHLDPESGKLSRFEYEIDRKRKLVVEGAERPEARLEDINYAVLLDTAEGVIDDSLFQAVADIGESPQLALSLVKLFGSEINFTRNLEKGDTFSVLIEKRYKDGEYSGYGRIIAAVFTNRGKTYEAFLFRNGKGEEMYYNADGENLNKTLLQSPLAATRMTSRFSQSRFHPILRVSRPHLGVDYGAPVGTQVKAVGDGTVTSRGWAGGYGNQIVIKHGAGLESLYSHLSGFARGVAPGAKVKQGQVIGFVGSTGLATGPHLDFRLRQNGEFINPAKAINPRGRPVAKGNMEIFKKSQALARACLAGKRIFENYTVDSIVPLNVKLYPEEEDVVEAPAAPLKYRRFGHRRFMRKPFHFLKPSDIMKKRRRPAI